MKFRPHLWSKQAKNIRKTPQNTWFTAPCSISMQTGHPVGVISCQQFLIPFFFIFIVPFCFPSSLTNCNCYCTAWTMPPLAIFSVWDSPRCNPFVNPRLNDWKTHIILYVHLHFISVSLSLHHHPSYWVLLGLTVPCCALLGLKY